ncbi:hypothetical protein BU24DRAFT_405619 [Aaosphaeria arxii CBS 175.79]|uniref:Phosphoglycerate mutase family protein n=1 Tax=Aaosphaeria arxii CBS 175.79 TaxID=1450172 RepID=A0A6A5Y005_9PLEO|nr:uncharacterized protein BU24DRAFT_405619 [Aaosphaeria arxii CBS 175.79]KAF2018878.1 hypothetical protein BU24DRAFT_405619 [Aaosphaeria arxii CBS 175.79]
MHLPFLLPVLFTCTALTSAAAVAAAAKPTVYLIRHGEKPEEGTGLSAEGVQRAQCLRKVFGKESKYDIGHVMAQQYKPDGKRKRAYDTVLPVATDLNLPVDLSCDRDDPKCVRKVVEKYDGSGNILIAWEHDALRDIVIEMGVKKKNAPKYPDDRFDLIWTLAQPYEEVVIGEEECEGLDRRDEKRERRF